MKLKELKSGDKYNRLTIIRLDHIENKQLKTSGKKYNIEYKLLYSRICYNNKNYDIFDKQKHKNQYY